MNINHPRRIEDLTEEETRCLLSGCPSSSENGLTFLPGRFTKSFPVGRSYRLRGQDHFTAVGVTLNEQAIAAIQGYSYYWTDLDRWEAFDDEEVQ